jgi:hypothetical protein
MRMITRQTLAEGRWPQLRAVGIGAEIGGGSAELESFARVTIGGFRGRALIRSMLGTLVQANAKEDWRAAMACKR